MGRCGSSRSAPFPGCTRVAPRGQNEAPSWNSPGDGSFLLNGRRDLGAGGGGACYSRRARDASRGRSGNRTRRAGYDVRKRDGTGVHASRVCAVAAAGIVIRVIVIVMLPVPPVEMATAEADESETRKKQQCRASHQAPLPQSDPKTEYPNLQYG
jgi:hypothetical protein